MAALFALGVMSLGWMAFIAALIAIEKLLPWKALANRGIAVLLLVLGLGVAFTPERRPRPHASRLARGPSGDGVDGDGGRRTVDGGGSATSDEGRVDGRATEQAARDARRRAMRRAQNWSSLDHSKGMCLAERPGPVPLEAERVRLVRVRDPVGGRAAVRRRPRRPGCCVDPHMLAGPLSSGPVITSAVVPSTFPATCGGSMSSRHRRSPARSERTPFPTGSPKHVLGEHLRPASRLAAEDGLQRLALSLVGPLVDDQPIESVLVSSSQMLPSKCPTPATLRPSRVTSP